MVSFFRLAPNLFTCAKNQRLCTQMPSKSEGLMLKASYAKKWIKHHCPILYFRTEQIALNERLEEVWLQA